MILFNTNLKLILADVDDTIAPPYVKATNEMVTALENVLLSGASIFLISGGGLQSIMERVTDLIKPKLRSKILIAHCSGAEVWGFDTNGKLLESPFYSKYSEQLNTHQKLLWRTVVEELEQEFGLEVYPVQPSASFAAESKGKKNAIMKVDRGPQITWECVNDPDMRAKMMPRIHELLTKNDLPIDARIAGVFALDFALKGISKEFAVKYVLNQDAVLAHIGLVPNDLQNQKESIEIWGDRYMEGKGSDQHMTVAVNRDVRSLDFRPDEEPAHFPKGHNIVLWDGKKTLCEGLLEYLRERQ